MSDDELIEISIKLLCASHGGSFALDKMLRKKGHEFSDSQFKSIASMLVNTNVIKVAPDAWPPNYILTDKVKESGICEDGWIKYKEKKEMELQRKFVHQEIKGNTIIGSTVQQSESGNNQSSNSFVAHPAATPKKSIKNTLIVLLISVAAIIIGTYVCYKMGWL